MPVCSLADENRPDQIGGAEVMLVTGPVPAEAQNLPLTNLLEPMHLPANPRGRFEVSLQPYGFAWFRVGPLLDGHDTILP